jgi:S-adenosyl methyltransferase
MTESAHRDGERFMSEDLRVPPGIDVTVPSTARMYDYYLGGTNNFPADQEAAEGVLRSVPWLRHTALENRAFLRRVVAHLTREVGIRQFIDIGAGLSAQGSHEVAHAIAPEARVVYVDHDPLVVTHNEQLLEDTGNAIAIPGDLRDPGGIITHPRVGSFIDWDEPVAVLLIAVLHFITADDDPAVILRRLREAMAPGSHLALTHVDFPSDDDGVRNLFAIYKNAGITVVSRDREETAPFFEGFDLLEPGLVGVRDWHHEEPGDFPEGAPQDVAIIGGVGRLKNRV